MNPGLVSAARGHYYAGPGNLFWRALYEASLTPRLLRPDEDHVLPSFGIGATDVVGRASASVSDIADAEWRDGAADLRDKLAFYAPGLVCFNGLGAARAALELKGARPGLQGQRLGSAPCFAVPSTSRRNAAYRPADILHWFRELASVLTVRNATTSRL